MPLLEDGLSAGPEWLLPLWRAIWSGRFQEGLFSYDFADEISYFHSVHPWEEPNNGGAGGDMIIYGLELTFKS